MESIISVLHPNPGWTNRDKSDSNGSPQKLPKKIVGNHCILELYECDSSKLNDEAFIRTTITLAAKSSGANLLNLITHRFEPQGVTALALLAESHISIHTWPESGYAAVDAFTCGDHTMPERACELIRIEFEAQSHSLKQLKRDTCGRLPNVCCDPKGT